MSEATLRDKVATAARSRAKTRVGARSTPKPAKTDSVFGPPLSRVVLETPINISSSAPLNTATVTFKSGAVRTKDAEGYRFDLISPIGLRRLAAIYDEGAKKYGDNNWRKGLPFSDVLHHALNHLNLWQSGDRTEDHLAKVAWGMFAIMEFEKTHPDQNDIVILPQ